VDVLPHPPASAPLLLRRYVLWASSDDVKTDLELVCLTCGEHLCDAQHEDSLAALASMAADHDRQHHYRPLEFWYRDPGNLRITTTGCAWDPATSLVAGPDGEPLGQAATADEARVLIDAPAAVYWEPFVVEAAEHS
jgi:hypothetical protein